MRPLELAREYMKIFFSGEDVEELGRLFASDLKFRGPFYQFDSAEDYINSLKADPPEQLEYEVIESFESESSACLVYRFSKPGISTPMAQMFSIGDGKIKEILLVFDTGAFT